MAVATSFKIPDTLTEFRCEFPCTLEQEQEALSTLAKQVAHTYAWLLTSEGHQNKGDFRFDSIYPIPPKFPSAEQVNNFEIQLAKALVDEVNSNKHHAGSVQLGTHYVPEDLLLKILNRIVGNAFEWHEGYFPLKIYTNLSINGPKGIIAVRQWEGIFM